MRGFLIGAVLGGLIYAGAVMYWEGPEDWQILFCIVAACAAAWLIAEALMRLAAWNHQRRRSPDGH